MKIVIDIDEKDKEDFVKRGLQKGVIAQAIENGTPLDHLTNGQVAKEIFGLHSNALSWNIRTQQWWNAPFKKKESD